VAFHVARILVWRILRLGFEGDDGTFGPPLMRHSLVRVQTEATLDIDHVLDVLDRLDAAGIEWWVDGGWGIDALLGEERRPHDDLDLVVRREEIHRLPALFPEFTRDEEWWPARFVLRSGDGRQIDFHPVEFDERGDGWQELIDGSRGRYPAADLAGSGRIGGRQVRCITPELQLRHHDYSTGGPDDIDWDDVRVLCERFGLAIPPAYGKRPGFIEPKRTRAAPRP
jgi:lincosamide nucleotidyltransferase A/C/D/E